MTNRPNDSTPTDSLAPIELDRLTIEEEVAFMNRGKGKSLAGIVAAAAVVAMGCAVLFKHLDTERAYVAAADGVREVSAQHLDSYLRCAVPATLRIPVDSGEQLARQLERAADHLGRSYALTLARCDKHAEALATELSSLSVPVELEAERGQLVAASVDFAQGTKALRERLSETEPYSYAAVANEIDRVAKAWDALDSGRSDLLAAVSAR